MSQMTIFNNNNNNNNNNDNYNNLYTGSSLHKEWYSVTHCKTIEKYMILDKWIRNSNDK